ncbi:hypothetical protein HOY80DRAFT_47834 [Tuber brumale]|nr:hypothetical protein HOY80DRAFT_47834 [Tuber brumale]
MEVFMATYYYYPYARVIWVLVVEDMSRASVTQLGTQYSVRSGKNQNFTWMSIGKSSGRRKRQKRGGVYIITSNTFHARHPRHTHSSTVLRSAVPEYIRAFPHLAAEKKKKNSQTRHFLCKSPARKRKEKKLHLPKPAVKAVKTSGQNDNLESPPPLTQAPAGIIFEPSNNNKNNKKTTQGAGSHPFLRWANWLLFTLRKKAYFRIRHVEV